MPQPLLEEVSRHTRSADRHSVVRTPVGGMSLVRVAEPQALRRRVERPLLCLVVQGQKAVMAEDAELLVDQGGAILLGPPFASVSQIKRATPGKPYLAFALQLDPLLIVELEAQRRRITESSDEPPPRCTDAEVAETALRLVRLLDWPDTAPMLQAELVREMHVWLLTGRHRPAIRKLAFASRHAPRIAKVVAAMRENVAGTMSVKGWAASAGMSASAFNHHFRAATSMSPLQYLKHARLQQAHRMMLAGESSASEVAHAVGYESASQFTREYRRLYGLPPARDAKRRLLTCTAEAPADMRKRGNS